MLAAAGGLSSRLRALAAGQSNDGLTCDLTKRDPARDLRDSSGEEDDDEDEDEKNGFSGEEEEEDTDTDDGSDEETGSRSETDEVKVKVSGWADSMAKILKSTKPKNKKCLILSRAKKDQQVGQSSEGAGKKPKDDLEVVGEDGVIPDKRQKLENGDEVTSLKAQRKLELQHKRKVREWENLNRNKPDSAADKERERELVKIATKGVVQLFNAVGLQQKTIRNRLRGTGNSEFRKDKVLSKTQEVFKDSMRKSKKLTEKRVSKKSNNKSRSQDDDDHDPEIKEEKSGEEDDNPKPKPNSQPKGQQRGHGQSQPKPKTKESKSKKPSWQVLQDDYMLNAKMNDWDQSSDDGDEDSS